MATIVQSYDPWREKLAAGIIGPILSHILQSSQEANQNRKLNAALGVIQSSLGGQNTPSQNQSISPYSRPQMPEGNTPWERASSRMLDPLIQFNPEASLVSASPQRNIPTQSDQNQSISPYSRPQMPEGNTPWERASSRMLDPLIQFNPEASLISASPQRNIPTQSDYLNAMTNILAQNRFSMLNRDAVAKALDPMIQASLDAQRKADLQGIIDNLQKYPFGSPDWFSTIFNGGLNGTVPNPMIQLGADIYGRNNLSAQDKASIDWDREKFFTGFNNLSAAQRADNDFRNRQLAQQDRHFGLTFGAGRDDAMYARGQNERIMRINALQTQLNGLISDRDSLLEKQADANDKNLKNLLAKKIAQVDANIQGCQKEILNLTMSSYSNSQAYPGEGVSITNTDYDDIINEAAAQYGVEPELIKAIIQAESNFNPNAVSNKKAQGLMQLIPDTARMLGVKNSFDPRENILGGTKYLRQMLDMFGGDMETALWAYNTGPGNVKNGKIPPETRKYAKQILENSRRLENSKQKSGQQTAPQTVQSTQPVQSQSAQQQDNSRTILNGFNGGHNLTENDITRISQETGKTPDEVVNEVAGTGQYWFPSIGTSNIFSTPSNPRNYNYFPSYKYPTSSSDIKPVESKQKRKIKGYGPMNIPIYEEGEEGQTTTNLNTLNESEADQDAFNRWYEENYLSPSNSSGNIQDPLGILPSYSQEYSLQPWESLFPTSQTPSTLDYSPEKLKELNARAFLDVFNRKAMYDSVKRLALGQRYPALFTPGF